MNYIGTSYLHNMINQNLGITKRFAQRRLVIYTQNCIEIVVLICMVEFYLAKSVIRCRKFQDRVRVPTVDDQP